MDDLVAEAGRVRRFEWRRLLLGTLIEAMMVHALEQDTFRDLFTLAVMGIGHLFGGGPIPPGLLSP